MIKKFTTILAALAMTLALAGNTLAAFADLELIRVYYDRAGAEIATDLGSVKSLIASPTTIPGSFGSLTTGYVVYFALDRTAGMSDLWASGSTTTPSVIVGGATGLTSIKSGSTNMYSLYNLQGGTNYSGLASAGNSYKARLSATQGTLATSINNATRLNTEASLIPLLDGTSSSVDQTLYFWDNALTTVGTEKIGVPVASITTNADGSTTISPPATVNGACGTADGQELVVAPTSNLCSSGSASVVSGSGPWNWSCNGQNGGTNASCSASVFQSTSTPSITWPTPAAITYGTPLSASQLNATATDSATSASVPGTFTYNPVSGSVLNAGTQTLSVTFTPTDTATYTTATTTVSLIVDKTPLTITANDLSKTYGVANPALAHTVSGFVNGDSAAVLTGLPALTTSAIPASPVGTYPIVPTAGTLAADNYSFTFVNGALTVNKAVLTITANNLSKTTGAINPTLTYTASGFVNGDDAAVLTGLPDLTTTATPASPAGTYPITPAAGTLAAANYSFTFVNGTLTITNLSVPVITWTAPAPITYGTPLSATQLNATANIPGSVAYSPAAGSIPNAGIQTLTATFTPTDTVNFASTSATLSLTVNKATPTITWSAPTAITYGTALSATQLNATASVPGTFVYSPVNGSVLNAGTQTLTVTFTPTDTINFATQTSTVNLTVNKAALSITANDLNKASGAANPALTYTASGFVNNDSAAVLTGLPSLTTTATTNSPVGTYPITPAAGTLAAANYSFTFVNGTLTVTNLSVPVITWATPAAITYGTALSTTQLNATANVPGTFAYNPAVGNVPNAGTNPLSVTFTPTDSANFTTQSATVNLAVNKAALTITASNLSKEAGSANQTLTYTVSGFVNGDSFAVLAGSPTLTTTATTSSPAGTYPITAASGSLTAANYSFNFVDGTMTVVFTPVYPSGDANGDGAVNISDALKTLRYVVGLETLTSTQWTSANVAPLLNNHPQPNNNVDIGDALVILKVVVGLVSW